MNGYDSNRRRNNCRYMGGADHSDSRYVEMFQRNRAFGSQPGKIDRKTPEFCGSEKKTFFLKKTSQKGLTGRGLCSYNLPPRHGTSGALLFPRIRSGSEAIRKRDRSRKRLFDIVNNGRDAQAAALGLYRAPSLTVRIRLTIKSCVICLRWISLFPDPRSLRRFWIVVISNLRV